MPNFTIKIFLHIVEIIILITQTDEIASRDILLRTISSKLICSIILIILYTRMSYKYVITFAISPKITFFRGLQNRPKSCGKALSTCWMFFVHKQHMHFIENMRNWTYQNSNFQLTKLTKYHKYKPVVFLYNNWIINWEFISFSPFTIKLYNIKKLKYLSLFLISSITFLNLYLFDLSF